MPSPSPDAPALSRFRHSVSLALSTHSRSAFDAACRALSLSTTLPLPDLLASPPLIADPHLALLLAAAADRRWLDLSLSPPPHSQPTWAGVLKRPAPRSPTPRAALLPTENGLLKTSFRRWKWDSTTLPSSPLRREPPTSPHSFRDPPPPAPDDASSVASSASATSLLRPVHRDSPSRDPNPLPPAADADFEAALLAGMPCLSDARPAAAAAAAAFRALVPFLPPDERIALRRAFTTYPPTDCLAMVVRVAELASAKHAPARLAPHQQSHRLAHSLVPAHGMLALSGAERGVWGAGVATGWPDQKDGGDAWDALYGSGRNKSALAGASGLDVNAPPFRMERALHGRPERL